MEGNFTRLRGEAYDPNARVRSPLADMKDGPADTEERSESTADDSTEERESLEESERSLRSDEEDDSSEAGARQTAEKAEGTESSTLLTALVVPCKCGETEVKASINTGSQHNHISTSCCRRLGLVPSSPCGESSSSVTDVQLQLGRQTVRCSAYVKEDEAFELCLGLQTLLELKEIVITRLMLRSVPRSLFELIVLFIQKATVIHFDSCLSQENKLPTPVPPASLANLCIHSVENQELPQIMLCFNNI
ncbi:hypothetical protein FQN60_005871 [Etheostoma spectabile]|uniref:Aspartic peptidase DDI1-type domain-containing protein n=1 Tax=Etheostoma spectabile TaxID=54343 RepID=A0A5J5CIE0_9PERO|nr:hypothetical protein FQN60_005871 [Etheostoma spectabile]